MNREFSQKKIYELVVHRDYHFGTHKNHLA